MQDLPHQPARVPPRRLTNDEANDVPRAWTPDSKAVLFRSDRNGSWGIFKQEIGQDTAETVATGSQAEPGNPILSADGAWILYPELPKTVGPSTPVRLTRLPVNDGVPQLVMETRNLWGFACARALASLCVVLEAPPDEKLLIVTAFDPLKGRGKVLRTIEKDRSALYASALSPDGSTLAISRTGESVFIGENEIHIRLLSLSGGSDREITVKGWRANGGLDWSHDGKGLYGGSTSPRSRTLLYVDLKGNARVLGQCKGGGGSIGGSPSPDGRYLAIERYNMNWNAWMLEGF
jgi:Tol biopolymer transport system component